MQEQNISSDDESEILPETIIQNPLHSVNFDIFSVDTAPLYSLVGHNVEVRTMADTLHSGTVYTIDPISFSFVLINTETRLTEIIMGHSIKHVSYDKNKKKDDFAIDLDILISKDAVMNTKEIRNKIERVEEWLKLNRVPVEREQDVLDVMGVVKIHPPYISDSCSGTNQIILSRIQKLIQNIEGGMFEKVL